jgi:RNA polymerase sigma-70 factor, ECF subfamily
MKVTRSEADTMVGLTAAESRGPSNLTQDVSRLFDELRAPLLRYLSSFGLYAQDAEEVAQEAFLALFLHLREGKPRTNLAAWIFRVGHNLALKRCMVNRRTTSVDDRTLTEVLTDDEPNPEQRVASLERGARLRAVVDALPELDRRCLFLRAEGLRYREIVEVLGMSLGAVAQSLERSLAKLGRADQAGD